MTHLELTTSIGPGGWERLTEDQQADALGWLLHAKRPSKAQREKQAHEDRLRKVREHYAARGG